MELSEQTINEIFDMLVDAHLILNDPDSDQYYAFERLDTLLSKSIKALKGEPV